jgi:hypothetical protein
MDHYISKSVGTPSPIATTHFAAGTDAPLKPTTEPGGATQLSHPALLTVEEWVSRTIAASMDDERPIVEKVLARLTSHID